MINRRNFLAKSVALSASLALTSKSNLIGSSIAGSFLSADETVITILHTNDTHSQIDPLPANDKNAGKGGVARRATLVKKLRKQNPNSLLIDAGDVCEERLWIHRSAFSVPDALSAPQQDGRWTRRDERLQA